MANISNPTAQDLWCAPAWQIIPAHGSIEVSDAVASEVTRSVFVVEDPTPSTEPAPADSAVSTEVAQLLAAAQKLEAAETAAPTEGA